jgi:long-chain acyl-CoA synthetase
MIADLAANAFSLATVPLYDTLGPDAAEYIINHADVPVVVCSIDKVATLIKISDRCPNMKIIITMESGEPTGTNSSSSAAVSPFAIVKDWAKEKGLTLVTMAELENTGKAKRIPLRLPSEEDVMCISYTSGTTGNPKGAMLTHQNLVVMLKSTSLTDMTLYPTDVHLSYLPLAHLYERLMASLCILNGVKMGFYRGDGAYWSDNILIKRYTVKLTNQQLFLSSGSWKKSLPRLGRHRHLMPYSFHLRPSPLQPYPRPHHDRCRQCLAHRPHPLQNCIESKN